MHYSKMASWPISRADGPIGSGCFRFCTIRKSKIIFVVISRYQVVITSRSYGIGITIYFSDTEKAQSWKWQEKFQKRQVRVQIQPDQNMMIPELSGIHMNSSFEVSSYSGHTVFFDIQRKIQIPKKREIIIKWLELYT